MSDVYANSLEISGKAVDAKTIAAFPDVCFTPPENPATPPGVPVPYPSFGMASDTETGTGTVKIGGKTVNIKNKSDLSKTSGTEAGCAAKKGVVTSKNTGKEFFKSWSSDVKFDGEPVIRMSDLATNNHQSDPPNTVTWPHIAGIKPGGINCEAILNEAKITLHKHSEKSENCNWTKTKKDSDHLLQNAFLQNKRGGSAGTIPGFGSYSADDAPCICMQGPSSGTVTEHAKKTRKQETFAATCITRDAAGNKTGEKPPTLKQAVDSEMKNVSESADAIKSPPQTEEKKKSIMECLEAVIYDYLERCTGKKKEDLQKEKVRVPGGDKVSAPAVDGGAVAI